MARIENKCDRILIELAMMRRPAPRSEFDDLLERMHSAAKTMREQSRREVEIVKKLLDGGAL